MAARAAAAALVALSLLVPGSSRAGSSARFAVAVKVVKSFRVRMPRVVEGPEVRAPRAGRIASATVRDESLDLGPAAPAALLALPGTAARPCAGPCAIPASGAAGIPAAPAVVTLLPDGAPAAIVER
jgi:hypothetical protein